VVIHSAEGMIGKPRVMVDEFVGRKSSFIAPSAECKVSRAI